MSDLMNLAEDECALLIDVLEKEHRQLQPGAGATGRPRRTWGKARRPETVKRLLWRLRAACSRPRILDASELTAKRLAGYC